MSSQFLSLEEAANKLGITTERLVELRSLGKVRGFRDGASWKFPETEIDRLADDLASESGGDYNPFATLDAELSDEDSDEFGIAASGSGILGNELDAARPLRRAAAKSSAAMNLSPKPVAKKAPVAISTWAANWFALAAT